MASTDREEERWREIARALSENWAWAAVLRGPAILALRRPSADPTMADPSKRGREVADELLRGIDSALLLELPEVRTLVLTSIYDQMAGRIVLG